jgi:putative phosphoribosyl transferase
MQLRDRAEGGQLLATRLMRYAGQPDVVVLGLPRGGVPVAFEVARALGAPLDVFVVRKLGAPGHEEFAIGAIATGGVHLFDWESIRKLGISNAEVEAVVTRESRELQRRELAYRDDRSARDIRGLTVILVDDGLATGSTMRAAVHALRQQAPSRIVVGVPVGSPVNCSELGKEADEVVCAVTPESFYAVGQWYNDFVQTTDEEVRELLARAASEHATPANLMSERPSKRSASRGHS